MVNVGIVGIGFMGMIHYLSYERIRGAKVRALCEKETKRLAGDWRDIKGNFGPAGRQMDLSGIETTDNFDDVLGDPQINLVDICLPPALHADFAVKALRAGKHVFCEKPIALSTADARRMVREAEKQKRLLMIGHVLPFNPEYAYAYKQVAGGKYGKLLGGHFKRIISDPLWLKGFYDPRKIGGPLLDLHVHDAHFIRLLCGIPIAVFSRGRTRGEVVEFLTTQFMFDDPRLSVSAASGVIYQQGRAFTHAFEIYLEKAAILFDFAVIGDAGRLATPVTLLDSRGKVHQPEMGSGDPVEAFVAELTAVVKAVRTGKPAPLLAADLARDAVIMCRKQSDSVFRGRAVKI